MIADTGYERTESIPPVRVSSPTEERNPRTRDIDLVSTPELVAMISDEDARIVDAVRAQHPQIVAAIDLAVDAILAGGRVHYAGAGTSGRMAFMDAAELLPTFGVGEEMFVAHIAGGAGAFARSVEGAEDDVAAGRAVLEGGSRHDVVVGIAASGRTPYVRGAFEAARELGAATVLIASNPVAPLAALADVAVLVDTGPEAITGSTRMKAGTAQKLVLNTLSTAVMVRLGKTYSNFMVEVVATNEKLRGRLVRLLEQATGHETEKCERALREVGGDLRVALVTLLVGVDATAARAALEAPGVRGVRGALDHLR
ncbi:N-acetylmuramic acid 6-phosphate etherase [Myceligenerans crystallogenes]|uniref:N-acetylmuramic acid 6-phosphate etherase n=1 Tax=Myceligenerans crystallogenes TaxID=316335 RepID=A0ABN2NNJ7_9MICO